MDGSVDELVELGVVRDEPHAYPVWLWDEEGGTDPSCGNVDLGYHILVDEVFHDDVGLGLVSERYSARDHLLVRCGGLVHVDVHVSVGCVHRYGRKGIAQCVRKPLEESLLHGSDCHRSYSLVGKVGWDDVQLAKIFAPDQQVVSEIAADHGIDGAHEVVGTDIDCCGALDRHRRP